MICSTIDNKMTAAGEALYLLYDNGRSLFYEDTEEMMRVAIRDPAKYGTTFGYSGTYWDYIKEMAADGVPVGSLIDLTITRDEIADILRTAGFTGYRFNGALEWIMKTVEMIRGLG